MMPTIKFIRLSDEQGNLCDLPLPIFISAEAAGADLRSAINAAIYPGQRVLIPTGFAMQIPAGYAVQILPRSGLALNFGVTVLNAPGLIDSDYRGPVGVILINHGADPYFITKGDRIAQMCVVPVTYSTFVVGQTIDKSARGANGFGHSGVK